MAAMRHGVSTVIIPRDNVRDLEEIDPTVKSSLNFITAQTVDTVLDVALNPKADIVPTIIQDHSVAIASKQRKPPLQQ